MEHNKKCDYCGETIFFRPGKNRLPGLCHSCSRKEEKRRQPLQDEPFTCIECGHADILIERADDQPDRHPSHCMTCYWRLRALKNDRAETKTQQREYEYRVIDVMGENLETDANELGAQGFRLVPLPFATSPYFRLIFMRPRRPQH